MEKFKQDLSNTLPSPSGLYICLSSLVEHYNKGMNELLDKHAPQKEKVITIRENTEWYNEKIATQKQIRRQKERKWHTTKMPKSHDEH